MTKLLSDSRLCWWLLLSYVLAAPFIPLTGIPIAWDAITLMDWQRILEVAVLLLGMGWVISFGPPLPCISPFKLCAWGAVFAIGLASTLTVANHVDFALLEWSWLLLLATLATMMYLWPMEDRPSVDKLILLMAFISCLAYLWWFWRLNAFIYFEAPEPGIVRKISFPGFSNVRFFSDYQSFMLFLLPPALQQLTRKGWGRMLGTSMVALYFMLALIAGSRSLIASHLVLHSLLLLYLGNRYRPILLEHLRLWAYAGIIFAMLSWLLPLLFFSNTGDALVATSLVRADSSLRTELWGLAWQTIQTHPWLGLGPMQYAAIPNPIAAHPHNLVMQFASEWGVPATLLLGWLVSSQILTKFRTLTFAGLQENDRTALAMTCAGTALMLQSMVAGALNYPVSQVMALLFFAYPVSQSGLVTAKGSSKLHVIGLIAIALVLGTITTLQSIQQRNSCFSMKHWPSQHYAPRFWQQGWIVGECGQEKTLLHLPGALRNRANEALAQPVSD